MGHWAGFVKPFDNLFYMCHTRFTMKTKKRSVGRPAVLRKCIHCKEPFKSRDILVHQTHCPKRRAA